MKRLKLALMLCAVAALTAACGGSSDANRAAVAPSPQTTIPATPPRAADAAPPSPADEFADARATYNTVCVRCHKENGEGGTTELDEDTTIKVPSFKVGHALKHSDADFIRKITNGDDAMPAFGKRLSREQIEGLVRFIRHEFQAGLQTGGQTGGH